MTMWNRSRAKAQRNASLIRLSWFEIGRDNRPDHSSSS
jgi:hypothetical protein